jgi:GntR family transcriptional regulator/MocR family aminotransferase
VILHRVLAERIRGLVASGRLAPGAKLPGARTLATELEVSRVTVTTALDQLVAEGYLEASERRSTRVTAELPDAGFGAAIDPMASGSGSFPAPNAWSPLEPVTSDGRQSSAEIDLGPESFSLALIDVPGWGRRLAAAWRELAAEPDSGATSYFGSQGDPVLRAAIASHATVHRGVRAAPDSVVITSGSIAALAAVARTWLGPGRTCVVEDPGGEQLRRALAADGATLIPVPVDADGLIVEALPDRADVALVTPSWQYPSGGRLPVARRVALLEWSRRTGCILVEDDCEGELRHAGSPLPTLQGMAEDGRVIYVNTFSKVLFPGIRTGFLIAPDRHRGPLLAAAEAGARPPGAVEQRALGRFVESGAYLRHLRRVRATLNARRAAFDAELRLASRGRLRVRAGEAGGHLVVDLPMEARVPRSATEVGVALEAIGVRIESLQANRLDRHGPDRTLVVYLTRADDAELREAARRLARVVGT